MSMDYIKDFPILQNREYIYFDTAATSQRPVQVMEAITDFYSRDNANPLRGLYEWSIAATEDYENARAKVAAFINAKRPSEIVFTRNTTESLNLIAYSWGRANVKEGDEILVAISEHHSNILPWQMIARETGAKLVWLECDSDGVYSDEELSSKISEKTKLVAIAQVSNVLGQPKPVKKIAAMAHAVGAVIVIDGAQSAPHMKVDVQDIDADFFVFSGHKMLGPMGIGVLYAKQDLLEAMPPFLTGGEMIEYVTREDATYAEVPHKFEAGTVNAAGAVGLAAAIDYLEMVGFDFIEEKEKELTAALLEEMKAIPAVEVYGSDDPEAHCGIVTFNIEGCHPHDVSSILDSDHICIRAGHHCAQPLMQYMGVNATCRASLYFYNTVEEIHRFAESLRKVRGELGYGS
ncbi:MAG: cysteine desulfurase [Firmicutes bacterium]|nr:cysteine desulfurase [Bacillota bacterium]